MTASDGDDTAIGERVAQATTVGTALDSDDMPIYLDYQATTPADPRVVEAMLPYFTATFGNPHSKDHAYGWRAEEAVEAARREVAALIGARPWDVVFTSGATESNNLAIKGVARAARAEAGRDHVVTVSTEHKCVLEACARLEREGFRVTYLGVDAAGLIDLDGLAATIDERTALVSVMAVNNEIGVIQPLAEIGRLCRERGVAFHTDAAQAAGKIPLDVNGMTVDLMSLSAHKLYGPMGIGALYVRRERRVGLEPLLEGGGQEKGLRAGTLPLPNCVGFGVACRIAAAEMADEAVRLTALRERFLAGLRERQAAFRINGDLERRIPGNLNLAFEGIEADDLILAAKDLAISTGSACTSAAIEPSHVLAALGLDEAEARGSVRVGFGRFTTEDEVERAAARLAGEAARLR